MTDINRLTAVFALFLLGCAAVGFGGWLIDRDRTKRAVFTEPVTVPGPGMCGCGAPKHAPEAAPIPGEMLAAPVAEPEPDGQDDDTVWRRHGIDDDVWARLRAEVKS